MTPSPKLTTTAACRVAGLNRDRFNEYVAADRFTCAPETTPGRARFFGADDMLALMLFRQLMDDGLDAARAGRIACSVADAARRAPDANAVSYIETEIGSGTALSADSVPHHSKWETLSFSGKVIRKVTTFNISQLRKRIAEGIEEERSIIGPDD